MCSLNVFPALPILIPLASIRYLGSTENRMKDRSMARLGKKAIYEIKDMNRVIDVTTKPAGILRLYP